MGALSISVALGVLLGAGAPVMAETSDVGVMRAELDDARTQIAKQRAELDQQEQRLRALEARLNVSGSIAQAPSPSAQLARPLPPSQVAASAAADMPPSDGAPTGPVGEAPPQFEDMPRIAVLGDEGGVITRKGQLQAELGLEYARADRNSAVFRGIEVVESVLIGTFDINQSRQDILTASAALRYGITDRLEIGARLPFVRRADTSVLSPVAGSTSNDAGNTIDSSASGSGVGDLELSARYQLTRAARDRPFLVGSIQAVLPTGSSPFDVPRDNSGRELRSATGAGFYGITPALTLIVPSDPAVLFGTLAYTVNLPDNVHTVIPPVEIDRVDPGDAISGSMGIGIALNPRLSLNLGYAHTWTFGTTTFTRMADGGAASADDIRQTSRDLQIGRFLFGVSYQLNARSTLNWSVEVGATRDAPDIRTVLRIPFNIFSGR